MSGKLIMNVLVMYDRQSETLWSQLLGEAVQGELQGTKLEYLPSLQTTWEDWKRQYPNTLALRKGYSGFQDPYTSYYSSSQTGVIGETTRDDRLYVKEFVVGVERNGDPVAYPFSVLNKEPVVNHQVGGDPALVVFNVNTGTAVVFDREVNGQVLTFSQLEGTTIMDEETGTIWNGLTGEAIDGSLLGTTLVRIKSTSSFWFGWKDWFPESEIYGLESAK